MAKTVLLALTDAGLRDELSNRLRREGVAVHTVGRPKDLLPREGVEDPKVIVLDLGFSSPPPEELVRLLRRLRPESRIIGVAAASDPGHARVVEEGLFYYAVAPTVETLHTAVRAALEREPS